MRNLIVLTLLPVATTAFAHDSTMPHIHPHGVSLLPDYAAMLLAAVMVACGVIAFRVWRKG